MLKVCNTIDGRKRIVVEANYAREMTLFTFTHSPHYYLFTLTHLHTDCPTCLLISLSLLTNYLTLTPNTLTSPRPCRPKS